MFFFILFLFLNFTIFYWFCQILKWIRHRCTCVPHTFSYLTLTGTLLPFANGETGSQNLGSLDQAHSRQDSVCVCLTPTPLMLIPFSLISGPSPFWKYVNFLYVDFLFWFAYFVFIWKYGLGQLLESSGIVWSCWGERAGLEASEAMAELHPGSATASGSGPLKRCPVALTRMYSQTLPGEPCPPTGVPGLWGATLWGSEGRAQGRSLVSVSSNMSDFPRVTWDKSSPFTSVWIIQPPIS